jgi:uncharacterized protein (DUF486 family)
VHLPYCFSALPLLISLFRKFLIGSGFFAKSQTCTRRLGRPVPSVGLFHCLTALLFVVFCLKSVFFLRPPCTFISSSCFLCVSALFSSAFRSHCLGRCYHSGFLLLVKNHTCTCCSVPSGGLFHCLTALLFVVFCLKAFSFHVLRALSSRFPASLCVCAAASSLSRGFYNIARLSFA